MKTERVIRWAIVAAALAPALALALPGYEETRTAWRSSEAWLLARDGAELHSLRVDKTVRRLSWTPLAEIAPALRRAVILAEDKNFFEHAGVDWKAAGNAAWNNFWNRNPRGASTISMQLVGLLEDGERRRGRRSLFDKLTQSAAALWLETHWTKAQILEAYLNLASFRGELQGIGAVARAVFGKWPDGLDERESAVLAALLRAPNAAPALVARRACALLKDLGRAAECADLEGLATLALAGPGRIRAEVAGVAPHLAVKLLKTPGQRVVTSLDAGLQRAAHASLRRHLAQLARQNAQDGAVLVLDNASGEVLAWVGSSGDLSNAEAVDGVVALRQAGSTLKPFLYALAFERRNLTPASLIEDAPLTLDAGSGLYAPQNYEAHYRGWVSARMALAGSLNVPAVKVLTRITPDAFAQRLRSAGLASLTESGDWYGFSLALGSADVSLLMLTNAYRALANGGRWSPLRVVRVGEAGRAGEPARLACKAAGCNGAFAGAAHAAFTPQSAFLVGDILSDRAARAGTFGFESWLATPYWSAVKTGTSKDMRDNWAVGYTRQYTVGVWVGNAEGTPMHDVSGVSGAAPVWREVMDWLQRGDPATGRPVRPSVAPPVPAGVEAVRIRFEPAREAARREWFIAGTGQPVVRAAAGTRLARIEYPPAGTTIALDPDIPPPRQRVALRLSGPAEAGWRWRMDDQVLSAAEQKAGWLPRPGRHRLALLDAQQTVLDQVDFEVRALKGKAGR